MKQEKNVSLEKLLQEEREKVKTLQKQLKEEALLTAILFHDMKSPIATVQMNIEALQDIVGATGVSGAVEIVDLIRDQINAMGELVAQMLALSRIEDGVLEPERQKVELKPYLQELADHVRKGVEQNDMNLCLNIENAPENGCFDPVLMRRVLSNLLVNAVNHSVNSDNVGLIARELEEEEVRWLELEVWDHGVGVEPKMREKIFEKYFSLDEGGHAKRTSGLGLYFCKIIAEKLGGSIRVEDFGKTEAERGSRFIIRIPAAPK